MRAEHAASRIYIVRSNCRTNETDTYGGQNKPHHVDKLYVEIGEQMKLKMRLHKVDHVDIT